MSTGATGWCCHQATHSEVAARPQHLLIRSRPPSWAHEARQSLRLSCFSRPWYQDRHEPCWHQHQHQQRYTWQPFRLCRPTGRRFRHSWSAGESLCEHRRASGYARCGARASSSLCCVGSTTAGSAVNLKCRDTKCVALAGQTSQLSCCVACNNLGAGPPFA